MMMDDTRHPSESAGHTHERAARSRTRQRRIAWGLAAVSAVVLVASLASLAGHIARYNERNPPSLHYFLPVTRTQFTYAGREVAISDRLADDGSGALTIRYGQRALELPIGIPLSEYQRQLPPIMRHADWFRLLLHREGESFDPDVTARMLDQGQVRGRLIAVVRRVRPGLDPRSYGQVFRGDWIFEFHTFQPDGGWESERRSFPESDRALARRQREARREGEPVPERSEGELAEGTWRFEAAMHVMPQGAAPKQSFTRGALVAAGWRWPVAGLSLMALMFSIAVALAPSRKQRWSAERARAEDA